MNGTPHITTLIAEVLDTLCYFLKYPEHSASTTTCIAG